MIKKILFFIFIVFVFRIDVTYASLTQFDHIKAKEPNFSQIINQFFKKEGLTNTHFSKWEKKIKTAPLLPTLYIGYDHSLKESQGLSVNDNISISSGRVTIGPEDNDFDFDNDLGQTFRVRAVWKLDELIFNRNQFILSREKRDVAKIRIDFSNKIYHIYEQRYLHLLKYLQLRSVSKNQAQIIYSKYLILTDQLDALTGGAFRKRWWKRRE